MIYDIRHVTTYEYGAPVTSAHCALRLLPTPGVGQSLIATNLAIDPVPSKMEERLCFFGNRVTSITVQAAHRKMRIEATSSVDIDRAAPPMPALSASWESVREAGYSTVDMSANSPAHFLYPSRFVPRFQPAADYARQSFAAGRPILESAVELMHRMRADFKYDPKATVISTPLSEAFEQRRGVCQDFAHIMIAGLRGIGLSTAYVSGYLRTIPSAGKPRLEGADATHAWVSVWCGREIGWVGLDPTNALMIGNDHIVLARGRDYGDISPVAGIILGSGDQEIEVKVDVIPRA